ncbi:MAG TPA: hypothetical protein VFC72_04225, partial [Corynebacterium sp.]|nr:hypothetical protein [Corynebacterium sp.]
VISILIGLGIAWGMTQWLGDGAPPLSAEWFANSTAKFESLQDEGRQRLEGILPSPESLDLPTIPNDMTEPTQ